MISVRQPQEWQIKAVSSHRLSQNQLHHTTQCYNQSQSWVELAVQKAEQQFHWPLLLALNIMAFFFKTLAPTLQGPSFHLNFFLLSLHTKNGSCFYLGYLSILFFALKLSKPMSLTPVIKSIVEISEGFFVFQTRN